MVKHYRFRVRIHKDKAWDVFRAIHELEEWRNKDFDNYVRNILGGPVENEPGDDRHVDVYVGVAAHKATSQALNKFGYEVCGFDVKKWKAL